MRLTDRILASGVSLTDLIHIVITGDTSQSPEGSSYKASISQVKSLFGDQIIITGTGITSSIRKNSGNLSSGNFASSIPGSGNTSSGHLSYSEGENTISSGRTSHSQGYNTIAGGDYSHSGGYNSKTTGNTSFIHSKNSTVYSDYSTILGGSGNTITGLTVPSGSSNNTAIIAGNNNLISNQTIINGLPSLIGIGESINSTIIGGEFNNIYGHKNSSIIGGSGNTIHFDFPVVFNHTESIISSNDCGITASTISNILSSSGSSIVTSNQSSIIGGNDNHLQFTNQSSILFGFNNSIGFGGSETENSHIFGGKNNTITGTSFDSIILGGSGNTINTNRSIILGGSGITANTSDMIYVPDLTIDGLINVTDLQTNSNGKLVDGTSDARLKQNINELTNSLYIINNLRGVSFEYTPESKMGSGIRYGFIAQEVQEFVPDIVRSRVKSDGMLSLNYSEIVPILVESVKELSNNLTLTVPVYTPTSSTDINGNEGDITRDDNYMYIKTNSGWRRSSLEQF
jgi:hypothetical protein